MKAIHVLLAAGFVFAASQASAQGASHSHDHSTGQGPTTSAAKQAPLVKAEVRKVDAARGKVTLKHGPIPNLDMPAMTMVFPVTEKKLLDGFKTGDLVRVRFEEVKGQAAVTAIEPVK